MAHADHTLYFTWPLDRWSCIALRVQSVLHPGAAILHTLYTHKWDPEPIWIDLLPCTGTLVVCAGLKCLLVSTCFMVPLLTLQHKKREFTSNCIDFGKNVKSSVSTGNHILKFNLSATFGLSTPLKSNTSTADFKRLFLILQNFAVFYRHFYVLAVFSKFLTNKLHVACSKKTVRIAVCCRI
jgi:hypothetical protein